MKLKDICGVVEVTKKHIRKGQKLESESCPVALAIRDKFGDKFGDKLKVDVEEYLIRVSDYDKWFYSVKASPKSVQRFVKRFDGNKSVKPFKFRLKASTI